MKRFTCIIVLGFVSSCLFSQTSLPTFFGDHMVLQQKSKVAIWGKDTPDQNIEIRGSWGEKASVKTDKEGNWKVFLKTIAAGGPYALTVNGSEEIVFKNLLLGEVWLCLGQSNMGWALRNTFEGEATMAKAKNSNLRIYKSDRQNWHEPKTDCPSGKWSISGPQSAGNTSAVSYYFAERLQKELGVPVGIIVQAYAGTPIEGWMPWDVQSGSNRSISLKSELDETSKRQEEKLGFTEEKAFKTYQKQLDLYQKQMAANDTMKNKVKKRMLPVITKPARLGNQYPSNIYNAMVHPLLGYGIKGIIWYQGERNSKTVQQARDFKEQLQLLIGFYRKKWHEMSNGNVNKDFYFSMTQLPSWNPVQTQPVEGLEAPWAVSRHAMLEIISETPNTGLAVSIDTGDAFQLHPKNKKPIGYRHAFNVLHDVYKKPIVAHGPYFDSQNIEGNKIILTFNSVGSGLITGKKGKLNTFAIAGEDKKWHWADVEIIHGKVVVYSDKVTDPKAVRYAWAMNPSERNLLYNKEGLPASPFRTDTWKLFEKGSDEVTVFKPKKPKGYKAKDWDRPKMQ
ncbi:sialate O-acetylesterase [Tamlana sp. 2201CG12-4]|uniref:sialate O-acetylesterase n=1 Tax=Tamlana sp. 2201CG12-4 TaxID=3112582 RepID=UPI002DBF731C|nr:sialate O-acetylesterase [Tamlana sp. 2201CG12-4]MEC3905731.1 sialate O-acetylesterase [Tamlana sp. 2201CG12-4]